MHDSKLEEQSEISIGDTAMIGDTFCFFDGSDWEEIKDEHGNVYYKYTATETVELPATIQIYGTGTTPQDQISFTFSPPSRPARVQSATFGYPIHTLTPYEVEALMDQLETLQQQVNEMSETLTKYAPLGTPEEIEKVFDVFQDYTREHDEDRNFIRDVMREINGYDETGYWEQLRKKGWQIVATDPSTFDRLKITDDIRIHDEENITFVVASKDDC